MSNVPEFYIFRISKWRKSAIICLDFILMVIINELSNLGRDISYGNRQ